MRDRSKLVASFMVVCAASSIAVALWFWAGSSVYAAAVANVAAILTLANIRLMNFRPRRIFSFGFENAFQPNMYFAVLPVAPSMFVVGEILNAYAEQTPLVNLLSISAVALFVASSLLMAMKIFRI